MWVGGRVVPAEERLVALAGLVQPLERLGSHFLVEGLHAFARELAGVLDLLFADAAELRVGSRIVYIGRPGVERAAGPYFSRYAGFFWPG